MDRIELRRMASADRSEVADLIYVSTNYWYETHGRGPSFSGGPASTEVFYDVYEALDPGCGVVALSGRTGRIMGSCFYHPRPTHVSLGIMNVHPGYFRQGVARAILGHIIDYAQRHEKPLRLVSSGMNLDSFSLYTRAGFVPRLAYQDMIVAVPEEGLADHPAAARQVRTATAEDVEAIAALEAELVGIRRDDDYRYFVENNDGFWHISVCHSEQGVLEGFMVSSGHPALNMIGPGVARSEESAAALLLAELNCYPGRQPLMLLPVECDKLVRQAYQWGARNWEMHFLQVRGQYQPVGGVTVPTFLPESG